MHISNLPLERELAFTETYIKNIHEDKSIREMECMKTQLKNYFVLPKNEDIIAGRISRPYIGFFPIFEVHGTDKISYCIDDYNCNRILAELKEQCYDREYTEKIEKMISFWNEENTNFKIRKKIPKEWEGTIGGDDFNNSIAAIHPIYRLAGTNPDMKKLFKFGLRGLMDNIKSLYSQNLTEDEKNFLRGMCGIINSIQGVIDSYIDEIKKMISDDNEDKARLENMIKSLKVIRENPPQTLQDALQLQVIVMLCGRITEIGRLDNYLCEFYRKDLKNNRITKEQAVDLVDNFFTIIEQEQARDTRAIIGGYGREYPKSADEFDIVVLDVLERRKFRFYPQISLRYYKGMNQEIYDKSLKLIGEGYTFPLLFNDDVNIPSIMRAMDVSRKLAEQYSFYGCGEFIIDHKSVGTPNTIINMAKILNITLHNGVDELTGLNTGKQIEKIDDNTSFEQIVKIYKKQLDFYADISGSFEELVYDVCSEESSFLILSMLLDDCISRKKPLLSGGIYHLGGTVETYGNITAIDSLAAIKYTVFEKKYFTLSKLLEMMDKNFIGFDLERKQLLDAPKYGNDDDFVDDIAVDIHEYIANTVRNQKLRTRLDSFLIVLINNNMNVGLGRYTGATANGRLSKVYLSNGNSASNGADKNGLPALIRSLTKLDTSIHAGGNQNLKFSKAMFSNNLKIIKEILSTYFDLGGQQASISVVDQKELEDAVKNPELHENLVVRVGGFSARFVHLDPQTQQDVLNRTAY